MSQSLSKFSGKKILVVEDYFINQEVTQDILELMDCEVTIAENGIEGVEKYQCEHYDLILMDIQMPELDGFEATRRIRNLDESKSKVPIIALTANALSGDREKCLDAGMDDYLSKPIEPEKLEEKLKRFFS